MAPSSSDEDLVYIMLSKKKKRRFLWSSYKKDFFVCVTVFLPGKVHFTEENCMTIERNASVKAALEKMTLNQIMCSPHSPQQQQPSACASVLITICLLSALSTDAEKAVTVIGFVTGKTTR